MLPRDFAKIDEAYLRELCNSGVPESQGFDIKRDLPGNSEAGRAEFLKDVCAFANAGGGDLVFGIGEREGVTSELSPVEGEADAISQRLTQIIDGGLEPRLVGFQVHNVPILAGGNVWIVRIPESFDGPYRFRSGAASKFVFRNHTVTAELTYDQLRSAFGRKATLLDKARRFRLSRLEVAKEGQAMVRGPLCVVHLIPLVAMTDQRQVDVRAPYHSPHSYMFQGWSGASSSFNLEGTIIYPPSTKNGRFAYVQVFRAGCLEIVRTARVLASEENLIPATTVGIFIREAVQKQLGAAKSLGLTGPAILGVSLVRAEDYRFVSAVRYGIDEFLDGDRGEYVLPDAWFERVESTDGSEAIVRTVLDHLWQCFGVEQCPYYDANGLWMP